ncbi:GNAT family protein [Craurococcus roseus]|uniref:GNAT family protein n=1 Tax=Craurococcus roseus TaxID=77585 RepID=A0ABN1G7R2_9PROT
MTLTTARLVLRPFAASDVDAYAAIRARPEVVSMLPDGAEAAARARADAERPVSVWAGAPPGAAPWAVEARGDGRLLGHFGLRPLPELGGETELLYMLDSGVRGRGLATEGGLAALGAAFGALGLRRVIAPARPENAASLAVMRKLGMRREAEVHVFGVRAVRCAAHAAPPEGGAGACTTC